MLNSTLYICPCGWTGLSVHLNVIRSESTKDGFTEIKYVAHCPRCKHEFTYKEHQQAK